MNTLRSLLFFGMMLLLFLPDAARGQAAQLFLEDFDAVTPPALPAGWSDPTGEWETSASVASTGSGLNNLLIQGTAPASLTTPTINLSGLTEGTLTYLARRTSTYTQTALTVLASTDGGASFGITVVAAGAGLPATDGSYQVISAPIPPALLGASQVVLRFDAAGGTSTGANLRIDDILVSGSADGNLLGFADATSIAAPDGTIDLDVYVDFRNAEALQGVQFSVDWDVPTLSFVEVIRGAAISNTSQWQVAAEAAGASARVVLLNTGATGLVEGVYDPLLTLRLRADAGTTAEQAVVTLSDLVSALAVPTGDDGGLGLGLASNTVTLPETGTAEFVPSATSFDLGSIAVGAAGQATLTVTNPGGTVDLIVSGAVSSNPLFTVAPTTATVAPGGSQAFTITFSPTATEFGSQSATLTFSHNAAGGETDITAEALGTGGRGDASGDGVVDVLDLVLGIDGVLERFIPTAGQLASLDVFPFAAPDGVLDVRDLTVLAQAIVLGDWPDGVVLPPDIPVAGKSAAGLFELRAEPIAGGLLLRAAHDEPVRAIQLALHLDEPGALAEVMMEEVARGEAFALTHHNEAAGLTRVLIYRIDGEAFAPGSYPLLRLGRVRSIAPEDLRQGMAVTASLDKMPMRLDGYTATGVDEEAHASRRVMAVYPNPYRGDGGVGLHVPLALDTPAHVHIALYDVLGREVRVVRDGVLAAGNHTVAWDPQEAGKRMVPGLYLVRVQLGDEAVTQPIVIR